MSTTYDSTCATDKDKVRFKIQDVDMASPFLQDEEINFALTEKGHYILASITCCEVLAARFAYEADREKIDKTETYLREQSLRFLNLAKVLKTQSLNFATPFTGGINNSEVQAINEDADSVKPAFTRGFMDDRSQGYMDR